MFDQSVTQATFPSPTSVRKVIGSTPVTHLSDISSKLKIHHHFFPQYLTNKEAKAMY